MSAVVVVTRVGEAAGSRAAAAALACVASEPDRAALLVELGEERALRPSLLATAGARALEERLTTHLPDATVASRGQICLLRLPADPGGVERLPAALPLARGSATVIHAPPSLLHPLLGDRRTRPTAVLLRADLAADRALAALAAGDLIGAGIRVAVLKRPLAWLAARAALLGALPAGAAPLLRPHEARLLDPALQPSQPCYGRQHDSEAEPA